MSAGPNGAFVPGCFCPACKLYGNGNPYLPWDFSASHQLPWSMQQHSGGSPALPPTSSPLRRCPTNSPAATCFWHFQERSPTGLLPGSQEAHQLAVGDCGKGRVQVPVGQDFRPPGQLRPGAAGEVTSPRVLPEGCPAAHLAGGWGGGRGNGIGPGGRALKAP